MWSFDVPPSNKLWETSPIISRQDSLTSYVPRSDFHVALRNFPNLLLEVNSDSNQGDENRMLVQGACLVRLGNALKVGGPSDFVVKAVYINDTFEATEYTLFQPQRQVAEISEQHQIKVKNFCLFPHDNAVTAHCAHCRSTMSRQQPTTCILNSTHSSSYSSFTTSFTGVVWLTPTFPRMRTGCFWS